MCEKFSTFLSFGAVLALFCLLMSQVVQSYEDRATRGLPPSEEFKRMSHLIQEEQRRERVDALDRAAETVESPDARVQLAVQAH